MALHVSGWQRAGQSSLWKPRAHSNTGSSQHSGSRHCSKRLTWLPHRMLTITLGGEEGVSVHILRMKETWATGDEVACPGHTAGTQGGGGGSQRCEPPACSHFQLLGETSTYTLGQSVGSFPSTCSPLSASTLQKEDLPLFTGRRKLPARLCKQI